ncbi:uncharacterized protein LOC119743064 [Patiria miniata]|uniref:Uncharacterized protein n=1 Tax=Patiria miniata TaxID=46514 RepID=A0A914BHH4_PATMI|nr:uncharacterized protein LOC119743064 [Patiria miniata]
MGNQESASAGIHVEGSVSASGAVDAGATAEGKGNGPPSPKKRRLSFKSLRNGSFRRSFRIRRSGRRKAVKGKGEERIEMEGDVSDEQGAAARAAAKLKASGKGKPVVDLNIAAPLATDETENMDLDADIDAGKCLSTES